MVTEVARDRGAVSVERRREAALYAKLRQASRVGPRNVPHKIETVSCTRSEAEVRVADVSRRELTPPQGRWEGCSRVGPLLLAGATATLSAVASAPSAVR